MPSLRLGLLSTAAINDRVLAAAPAAGIEVVAVASRSAERAAAYARGHGISRSFGSYEDLLADDGIDAVYVSTPNGMHVEGALDAIRAGRHVLVEKPFAAARSDAERCFELAEQQGLVLTEGLMWRHLPQTRRLTERISAGEIGDVRLVRAVHSFPLQGNDPRWEPELAGGALMDVGCYCVSGVRLVAGEPLDVAGHAVWAPSGVDSRVMATLHMPGDVLGVIDCALDLPRRVRLEVIGAEGSLVAPDPWHARNPGLELTRADGSRDTEEFGPDDPFALELADFAAAITEGRPPLLGRNDGVGQAAALEAVAAAVRRR